MDTTAIVISLSRLYFDYLYLPEKNEDFIAKEKTVTELAHQDAPQSGFIDKSIAANSEAANLTMIQSSIFCGKLDCRVV